MEKNEYTLQLNNEQMQLVGRALDVYTRLSIGQLDTALMDVNFIRDTMLKKDEFMNKEFHGLVKMLKHILTGMRNGNYGLFNAAVPNEARVANHIYQSIRHQLWKDYDSNNKIVFSAYPADTVSGLEIKITKLP